MEYVNIISKEQIYAVPSWIGAVICFIGIAAALSVFIYWAIVKDNDKAFKYEQIVGLSALLFVTISFAICAIFFREPTGKCRYEATVDKDNMTVAQYEDFLEKYNPTIQGDRYYWEE